MQKHLSSLSLLAVCAISAGCTPGQPETKITNTYQAPAASIAPPANIKAICYQDADLNSFRVRMVQQQLVVGVLSCGKGADGKLLLEKDYGAFVSKYNAELATNAAEMKSVVSRKKGNLDVVVTEIANRTAQQPSTDPAFCSRHQRALAWSLLPQVTSLKEVPSPYDFGPEMKVFPCPK